MLRQQKIKISVIEKWNEYQKNVSTYTDLANELINSYNKHAKEHGHYVEKKFVSKVENLLNKLSEIENHLGIYARKLTKEDAQVDIQLNKYLILEATIQMNKVLACNYHYLYNIGKKEYEMKFNLRKAYELISRACEIREKIREYLPEDYDPNLDETRCDIDMDYNMFFPDKSQPVNEIYTLLAQARRNKDFDAAFAKYQEALHLAKSSDNYLLQFQIACEQCDKYSTHLSSQGIPSKKDDIDLIWKITNKMCIPHLFTIELATSRQFSGISNARYSGICITMYKCSNILLELSLSKFLTNDVGRKLALLTDAKSYLESADKLANKRKTHFTESLPLQKKILDQIKIIEKDKEKQNQDKLEKEKNEAELLKCTNEYNEKFHEILQSLDILDRVTRHKHRLKPKPVSPGYIGDADSPTSSEEEQITTRQLDNQSVHYSLNVNENIDLLNIAIQKKDIKQQIYLNVSISDYYRIEASRSNKSGRNHIDETITNLKFTMSYLLPAVDLINDINNGTSCVDHHEINHVNEWTGILLKETEALLNENLSYQKQIEEQYENSRRRAMEYIIQKYGRSAWFKNGEFDQSCLSINAQILNETRKRVKLLEHMHGKVQHVHNCFDTFFENVSEESSQQKMNNTPARQFRRQLTMSADSPLDPLASLTHYKRTEKLAITDSQLKLTLFRPPHNSKRQRSVSMNSYVDSNYAMTQSEYEKIKKSYR